MPNAEEVVINILAKDNASNILSTIRTNLESLSKVQLPKIESINTGAVINQVSSASSQISQSSAQISEKTAQNVNLTNNLGKTLSETGKKGENAGESINKSFKVGKSTFEQLNTLLLSTSTQFSNLENAIASLFGVSGLSGMIEKMWKGASERQSNMLYLIHQKGVDEANEYYNEIMDIVTQLPGDDTFLTNILNMASALDDKIKVDNLKEMGTAITDYYIASTMKGENSFEVQKDLRKYITQGDTKMMRNSILASEIDTLKNKNSVLERTMALEKALDKLGFSGMSEYESATNELEEFKGHFQKAFADLGQAVIFVVQPLMKFYNTMDTVFGSRLSQVIILFATALIGFFGALATTMITVAVTTRSLTVLSNGLLLVANIARYATSTKALLNAIIWESVGAETAENIAIDGNIIAGLRKIAVESKEILISRAKQMWTLMKVALGKEEALVDGLRASASATVVESQITEAAMEERLTILNIANTREKYLNIFATTRQALSKWISGEASLSEAFAEEFETTEDLKNTYAKISNTVAHIRNALSKMWNIVQTGIQIGVTLLYTVYIMLSTGATFSDALAQVVDADSKLLNATATEALVGALESLWAALGPIGWIIIGISVAIMALIPLAKLLGEVFGGFDDVGGMFGAIGDGINRMWEAFMNSDIVQGIIQYFGDFIDTIKDLFDVIFGFFDGLGGKFDIVQSIIDIFGKLGEVIKWVWNLLDDWSNSPLGIITWLNPIGILIFHLDELGSFLEDVRDAILRFSETTEFQELCDAFNEAVSELQEPFQEIWELINEIISSIGEVFQDPEGTGTEDRINLLVEIFKGLAFVIRVTVIPAIRAFGFIIKVVLLPIRAILVIIKSIIGAIQWASQIVEVFGAVWEAITSPLQIVYSILEGVGNMINQVSDAIKNSPLGKLFGWDKEENKDEEKQKQIKKVQGNLYDTVQSSNDIDPITKRGMLNELNKQRMTSDNINNVRNLGSTYNHNDNQKQVVINQNFAEGSMPIDARNMTKKEARKMFINAFGYRRAVGYNGILR